MAKNDEAAKKAAAKKAEEAAAAAEAAKKAEEEAAAAEAAKKATVKLVGFNVTAKQEGFRRAGRAWSKTETFVPLEELTEEQIAQLKSESMLDVEEIAKTE